MSEFLEKQKYPRYWTFTVAANASSQYEIDVDLPSYVKKVIGICCFAGGVDPNNTAMITAANSDDLFLTLKNAAGMSFDKIRLDQLLFEVAAATVNNNVGNRFYPVNLDCNDFDLNTSYIYNPAAVNAAIMFGFLYI